MKDLLFSITIALAAASAVAIPLDTEDGILTVWKTKTVEGTSSTSSIDIHDEDTGFSSAPPYSSSSPVHYPSDYPSPSRIHEFYSSIFPNGVPSSLPPIQESSGGYRQNQDLGHHKLPSSVAERLHSEYPSGRPSFPLHPFHGQDTWKHSGEIKPSETIYETMVPHPSAVISSASESRLALAETESVGNSGRKDDAIHQGQSSSVQQVPQRLSQVGLRHSGNPVANKKGYQSSYNQQVHQDSKEFSNKQAVGYEELISSGEPSNGQTINQQYGNQAQDSISQESNGQSSGNFQQATKAETNNQQSGSYDLNNASPDQASNGWQNSNVQQSSNIQQNSNPQQISNGQQTSNHQPSTYGQANNQQAGTYAEDYVSSSQNSNGQTSGLHSGHAQVANVQQTSDIDKELNEQISNPQIAKYPSNYISDDFSTQGNRVPAYQAVSYQETSNQGSSTPHIQIVSDQGSQENSDNIATPFLASSASSNRESTPNQADVKQGFNNQVASNQETSNQSVNEVSTNQRETFIIYLITRS
jgi:hypothetical protein